MIPVLRVILPAVDLIETARDLGGELHNAITRGLNVDYITDDTTRTKPIPATALYAARMDASGAITVVRTRQAALTPDHTYLGWPIPA